MRTHVALLRGINVGGQNRVAMSDLRGIVTALGYDDVATYIQSGNVVFGSPPKNQAEVADALQREIAARLGVNPLVVVLSREELATVITSNPYPHETNPTCLHAVFHRDVLTADAIIAVAAAAQRARDRGSRDQATAVGRTVFLHTPNGLGRSELAEQLARPGPRTPAGTAGTARNWATVTRLRALLDR